MVDLLHNNQSVRFLTKIKIEFDASTKSALFSLPDFGVPQKKGEAVVDWNVIESHRDYLLSPNEVWGIVEIVCEPDDTGRKNVFRLVDFAPFCPYTIELDYYVEARDYFTIDEWIDIMLGAIDYRAVVDQLIELPKNSATRDTEAIKRICTAYLKLLFPNATDVSKVNIDEFETYCLEPAKDMRRVIKTQLGIMDRGEFGGKTIPDITIKEQYRENK